MWLWAAVGLLVGAVGLDTSHVRRREGSVVSGRLRVAFGAAGLDTRHVRHGRGSVVSGVCRCHLGFLLRQMRQLQNRKLLAASTCPGSAGAATDIRG